jgi:hypothetical protein
VIALLLLLLAQAPGPDRVKCTTTGGPIPIGTEKITVPLKCCPPGMYVADPGHPELDKKGNLICAEET